MQLTFEDFVIPSVIPDGEHRRFTLDRLKQQIAVSDERIAEIARELIEDFCGKWDNPYHGVQLNLAGFFFDYFPLRYEVDIDCTHSLWVVEADARSSAASTKSRRKARYVGGYLSADGTTLYLDRDEWRHQGYRFSIAHECGHVVLHRYHLLTLGHIIRLWDMTDEGVLYRRSGTYFGIHRLLEREANRFAAEVLMPRKLVETELTRLFGRQRLSMEWIASKLPPPKVYNYNDAFNAASALATYQPSRGASLCRRFGVSPTAFAWRIVHLHLLED